MRRIDETPKGTPLAETASIDIYHIISKKHVSLKPGVRTRRSYNRAGLIKEQKSFQGLAMYGHEVLMSLQKRAKLFGTHFSSEVAVKSCCVLVRKP
jgi:hypothetical protein